MPYYRKNLYVLCITIFLAAVSWMQVMPFLPKFLEDLGVKGDSVKLWAGAVYAAHALASIVCMPLWGKLGDTHGRKLMILRAGFFLTSIYVGMYFCQSALQLVALRFLNGALTGFMPGSFALIATNTPQEHAPRSVSTAQAAGAIGAIIGPVVGSVLAEVIGRRGSMLVSGSAILFSTLLVWALVQEPNKPVIEKKTRITEDFLISVRSPLMASLMLATFIGSVFGNAISPILPLHLEKLGVPITQQGIVMALPGIAFAVSAWAWTRIGERVGFGRALMAGIACSIAFILALAAVHNVWAFGAVFFCCGLCMSAVSPSVAAVTCQRVRHEFRGRAYGMQQSSMWVASLIASLTSGGVAYFIGNEGVFVVIAVVVSLGLAAMFALMKRWEPGEVPADSEPSPARELAAECAE